MRIGSLGLVIAIVATPTIAQDFEFEFDEDFTFDEDFEFNEDLSFEIEEDPPSSRLEISASVGLTRSGVGVLTDTWAAQVNLANQHDLGSIGYLEWAGNVLVSDLGVSNDISYDLSRVHIQNSSGDFSWKIGKYRIGWGEIEGAPILDVLNSGMSLTSGGLPSDELPGQWFVSGDYFGETSTVSGFVSLSPEVEHLGTPTDVVELEYGAKASLPIDNGAINLYAAQLVPQSGVVDLDTLESNAEPYTLVGVSANRTFDNVLIELDFAGKFGLKRSTLEGLSEHDRVDAAIGFEFAATNTLQVSGAVIGQHWLEQSEDFYLPFGYPSQQTTASYMLMANDTYMDGKLGVSANFFGALDSSMRVNALSATYALTDTVELGASAMWLGADAGTPFEFMDGQKQYGLTASFSF